MIAQFRFFLLQSHDRLSRSVKNVLTIAVLFRLLVSGGFVITTNLGSYKSGHGQGEEANWNGADFVQPSEKSKQSMRQLASDSSVGSPAIVPAIVEVYAINYRLPGYYEGIWGTAGIPKKRYLSRDAQWKELQRSECVTSDEVLDAIERAHYLEIYCPINYGELSLPVGFLLIRWEGIRPNKNNLPGVADRLFDVGRLISR